MESVNLCLEQLDLFSYIGSDVEGWGDEGWLILNWGLVNRSGVDFEGIRCSSLLIFLFLVVLRNERTIKSDAIVVKIGLVALGMCEGD